jgi:hypothetical protein
LNEDIARDPEHCVLFWNGFWGIDSRYLLTINYKVAKTSFSEENGWGNLGATLAWNLSEESLSVLSFI